MKDGITKWIHGWKRNGWRTADKKPVKNAELWQQLDELTSQFDIEWRWVKGHAGDPGNEKADELANMGCEVAAGTRPAPRYCAPVYHICGISFPATLAKPGKIRIIQILDARLAQR